MQRIRYSRYLKSIIILLDLLVIASTFIFFFVTRNEDLMYNQETWYQNIFSLALLFLFWMLLSGRTKIYNIQRNLTYTLFLERLLLHFILFTIGVLLIRKVSYNVFFNTDIYWLSFYLFFFIFLTKSLIYFGIKYFRSLGINYRNVMFLRENSSTEILKNIFNERKDYGPHMLAVDNYYKPKIGRYSLRSMVSPGITGLAQVSGLRGDSGNVEVEMNKRVLADAFYVRNWSFALDLVIILKTILLVLGGDKNAK